jgi:MYXO-CTERM domain-containing protein
MRALRTALFGLAASLLLAGSASAYTAGIPDLRISVELPEIDVADTYSGPILGGGPQDPNEPDLTRWRYAGEMLVPNVYNLTWDLGIIVDPVISGPVSFTNLTGSTQTVITTVTLPVTAFAGPTNIAGSIGATITDTGGAAGASLSTDDSGSGFPLYTAILDALGVPVTARTLFDSPTVASTPLPFDSVTINDNFGTPTFEVIGAGPSSDISIRIRMRVSAGDTAAVTSVFFAEPVPEPGTLGLGALAVAALLAVRRRQAL